MGADAETGLGINADFTSGETQLWQAEAKGTRTFSLSNPGKVLSLIEIKNPD